MAEIVAALPDVQIAVADAGRLHLDQHLGARRLRRRLLHLFQGGVEIGNLETPHRVSPSCYCWASLFGTSATPPSLFTSGDDGKPRIGLARQCEVPAFR